MRLPPLDQLVHDLRTPLGIIVAYADLLSSARFGAVNAKQARAIGHIASAAAAITELLERAEGSYSPMAATDAEVT